MHGRVGKTLPRHLPRKRQGGEEEGKAGGDDYDRERSGGGVGGVGGGGFGGEIKKIESN